MSDEFLIGGGLAEPDVAPFEEVRKLKAELEEKIRKVGKESIAAQFAAFFEKYPEIDGIVWTQYTPYFNDGDACVFGVNDVYVVSANICGQYQCDDGYPSENCVSFFTLTRYEGGTAPDEKKPYFEGMDSDLGTAWGVVSDEDILLAVFGDHAKIAISRDGNVEIDHYEHD